MMEDQRNLREYMANGSPSAIDAIVRRHSPMVRATCARLLGANHPDLDDIAQSVFLILIKKAPKLSKKVVLAGWLHKTANFAAQTHRRNLAVRRKNMERVANMAPTENQKENASVWLEIKPFIDESIEKLPRAQANAVVARFLENQSWSEVGESCACTEDTARMRCQGALKKIRRFLKKHGVICSGAVLVSAFEAHALEVGEGFAATALTPALDSLAKAQNGIQTLNSAKLAKEIMIMMFWKKIITAGAGALALVIALAICLSSNLVLNGKESFPKSHREMDEKVKKSSMHPRSTLAPKKTLSIRQNTFRKIPPVIQTQNSDQHSSAGLKNTDDDIPMEASANTLNVNDKNNSMSLEGKVKIKCRDVTITCDHAKIIMKKIEKADLNTPQTSDVDEVDAPKKRVAKIICKGNVTFIQKQFNWSGEPVPDKKVTSGEAVYDSKYGKITFTQNPVIYRGEKKLSRKKITCHGICFD